MNWFASIVTIAFVLHGSDATSDILIAVLFVCSNLERSFVLAFSPRAQDPVCNLTKTRGALKYPSCPEECLINWIIVGVGRNAIAIGVCDLKVIALIIFQTIILVIGGEIVQSV